MGVEEKYSFKSGNVLKNGDSEFLEKKQRVHWKIVRLVSVRSVEWNPPTMTNNTIMQDKMSALKVAFFHLPKASRHNSWAQTLETSFDG